MSVRRSMVATFVTVMVVLVGCSGESGVRRSAPTVPARSSPTTVARVAGTAAVSKSGSVTVSDVGSIDPGEAPQSSQMTAAPGGGIVYWTSSPAGAGENIVLVYVTEAGERHRWTVPLGKVHVLSNADAVTANDGVVWVAADEHLIRFDLRKRTVSAIAIPSVSDNPTAESLRPPDERGVHDFHEVAVDSAGHVAIALANASQVLIYDDTTRKFTSIRLPPRYEPCSVAYFSNGTLAVGCADAAHNVDKIILVRPDHTISKTLTGPDGTHLIGLPSGTSILAGTVAPSTISENGTVKPVTLPLGVKGRILPLRNGELVVEGPNRIVVVHRDGTPAFSYRYPGVCSGPVGVFPPTGTTPPTKVSVPTGCPPVGITGDDSSNLWLVSPPRTPTGHTELTLIKGL